ncbi:carboxyvinyl-carboxyphosphonate phosphorylmutase [Mycolicibacterium conceptionense]|jgi:2-methylisocitrate lyase-like PEP mutase family enzyme|uniref:Carboxyvinyl-carboxyphosphonate phosphorylmutase n=2 Tax=Mycolicibacterium TaxID=1866885 RepID=A0A0J8U8E7_9MYCO|nr:MULTISPECIES: isocitrate lyase/PEP mutase family protein [Mycolicibacterium]KLI06964.1 carboxyvinyl-carboxyphosphonate phosphorylmutase [Mycolicibacterium senegalense]KLO52482.1 carboxyvinyl-carboxyphosphonate phosphorylmutase [Mycolicibacterium senegalense]KMV17848.1 carboxyvinyl-carboxyphosphonate phosphorylmutase [Mycolicibacterium conceptionense]MCW1824814.1 isocitrate lyase/PEP mutase family protein [Mycolicibacterium senegalense]OBB10951.1 carboxyvinyl-carboxyphosphonate phosphorylmut
MTTTARARLRELLDRGQLIVAPGVYDGISAQLAKRTGHTAAYLTGAGVAASGFGLPDIGLVTQTEMVERARIVVRALGDVPLLADADTGYGAPINVIRTVREYEYAGVAALQLEDQAFPKRCGHLPDKELVSADDFVRTLGAALEARTDEDMLLIARTDARGPLGLDEAIARANRYAAEGADILFVEAPQSYSEIERIAAEVKGPLLLNLVIGGLTPEQSADRLQELGFAVAIHPSAVLAQSTLGTLTALCQLRGISADEFLPSKPEEFFNLVGMAEWFALGNKYQPAGQEV